MPATVEHEGKSLARKKAQIDAGERSLKRDNLVLSYLHSSACIRG